MRRCRRRGKDDELLRSGSPYRRAVEFAIESGQPLDVVLNLDGRELLTVIKIWNYRQKMAAAKRRK